MAYIYGHDLINQLNTSGNRIYFYDGLGSTRLLSDDTANVTDTYFYDAFGELQAKTGLSENDYLFTGEQFDPDLDYYYLRARYYDPAQARFTQMDTYMGNNYDPITLHKYLYANADPVNMFDPSGNMSVGGLMAGMSSVLSRSMSAVRVSLYKLRRMRRKKYRVLAGFERFHSHIFVEKLLPNRVGSGFGYKLERLTADGVLRGIIKVTSRPKPRSVRYARVADLSNIQHVIWRLTAGALPVSMSNGSCPTVYNYAVANCHTYVAAAASSAYLVSRLIPL